MVGVAVTFFQNGMLIAMLWTQLTVTDCPTVDPEHAMFSAGVPVMAYPAAAEVTLVWISAFVQPVVESGVHRTAAYLAPSRAAPT
jgi:hypothetical protein